MSYDYAKTAYRLSPGPRNVFLFKSPAVVTVRRSRLYPVVARPGPAWRWLYEVTGPDGVRFDNMNLKSLRDMLRRHYSRSVTILLAWEGVSR